MLSRSMQARCFQSAIVIGWCVMIAAITGCSSQSMEPAQATDRDSASQFDGTHESEPASEGVVSENDRVASVPDFSRIPRIPASSVILRTGDELQAEYHEVEPGETLTRIAGKYGISVKRLRTANVLDRTGTIRPGQLLYLP